MIVALCMLSKGCYNGSGIIPWQWTNQIMALILGKYVCIHDIIMSHLHGAFNLRLQSGLSTRERYHFEIGIIRWSGLKIMCKHGAHAVRILPNIFV
jgi:hypothetical protein